PNESRDAVGCLEYDAGLRAATNCSKNLGRTRGGHSATLRTLGGMPSAGKQGAWGGAWRAACNWLERRSDNSALASASRRSTSSDDTSQSPTALPAGDSGKTSSLVIVVRFHMKR